MLLFLVLLMALVSHLTVVWIDIVSLFLVARLLRPRLPARCLVVLDGAGAPITDAVLAAVRARFGKGAQLREPAAAALALAVLLVLRLVLSLTSGIVQIGSVQP